MEGKSTFHEHFFDNNVKYTTDLLYDMSNIASLNNNRDAGLQSSNFLAWTGLRQSVPLKLRSNILNLKVIFHLENLKSCDYYYYFIKQKYEKSSKWKKSMEEFNLEDKQVSEPLVLPLRFASEPYLGPFSVRF